MDVALVHLFSFNFAVIPLLIKRSLIRLCINLLSFNLISPAKKRNKENVRLIEKLDFPDIFFQYRIDSSIYKVVYIFLKIKFEQFLATFDNFVLTLLDTLCYHGNFPVLFS
jgi:hypothetical protein